MSAHCPPPSDARRVLWDRFWAEFGPALRQGGITPPPWDAGKLQRPPLPTRAFCLLPHNLIRWIGEPVKVPPRLHHLLGTLLDHGEETPVGEAEDALGSRVRDKTLRNALSLLNQHLRDVCFPWTYGRKIGTVVRK